MIFFIEGIVTIFVGILSYFLLPDRPEKARWLTEHEKHLVAFKIKSETPELTVFIERTKWQAARSGLLNINAVIIGCIFMITASLVQGFSVFYPTIISRLFSSPFTIRLLISSL